jgi:hypothetical protein
MRLLPVVVMIVVLILSVAPCERNSFDRERKSIQKIMANQAHLVSTVGPKRTGFTTQASWQCETLGGVKEAKGAFRRAVGKDYERIREDDLGLSYAKFDAHDSFYLTVGFQPKERNSTSVSVVLKSMPD